MDTPLIQCGLHGSGVRQALRGFSFCIQGRLEIVLECRFQQSKPCQKTHRDFNSHGYSLAGQSGGGPPHFKTLPRSFSRQALSERKKYFNNTSKPVQMTMATTTAKEKSMSSESECPFNHGATASATTVLGAHGGSLPTRHRLGLSANFMIPILCGMARRTPQLRLQLNRVS